LGGSRSPKFALPRPSYELRKSVYFSLSNKARKLTLSQHCPHHNNRRCECTGRVGKERNNRWSIITSKLSIIQKDSEQEERNSDFSLERVK
jgi:hypothetical protein